MDILNRYYTENTFSKLLIENLNYTAPNLIIDIGIGKGSLSSEAYKKWKNASFIGFDADSKAIRHIEETLPFVNIQLADSLSSKFIQNSKIKVGTVDIAICNPPYLKLKQTEEYDPLFKAANLTPCSKLKYLTADLVFLAQSLKLLKSHGVLGIILPDSLLTNYDFRPFRECLLKYYTIEKIIQLPDEIFTGTDARTHILIIRKAKTNNTHINLFETDRGGKCCDPIAVSKEALGRRMDYTFYKSQTSLNINNSIGTLGSMVEFIKRGIQSGKELREMKRPYLHLNDLNHFKIVALNHKYATTRLYTIAKKGDILISRVGKRSIGRISYLNSGRIIVSDCVYVIRPKVGYTKLILKNLRSENGKIWFKTWAHGVCSQVISKIDLLEFPIFQL